MDALTPEPSDTTPPVLDQELANKESSTEASSDRMVDWFRQASPYIDAHRNKTFVLCFSDAVLASKQFATLIQDISLLKTLGVQLVLVYGLRAQIDHRLAALGERSDYKNGLRITPENQLDTVIAEIGRARIFIESKLSMGLPNSPRSAARISIASGNFVTAQPYGVIDGIDHQHTGVVRQIHRNSIRRQIDNDQIVLLSPLGYSRTGELFNLEAIDVATQAAIALQAEKLIFIGDTKITQADGSLIRESTHSALAKIMQNRDTQDRAARLSIKAIEACSAGVNRVHIISDSDANALLKELFTRDGFGTMINADNYETLRTASILDVGGIIELIKPLEQDGTLIERSREQLELDIERFQVIERDGMIICCAALLTADPSGNNTDKTGKENTAEIACLATHPQYRGAGRAEAMLAHLEKIALSEDFKSLFVLTTRTNHWFLEHGFEPTNTDRIPSDRQKSVNKLRNSKVLIKHLKA